ncbi:sulfotransferase domain-containing protein [Sphingomonas sp. SRS2]|uniref:sulfotransferase domain-containing protein n=1 Tax=Sphingomonas sp. SRS2 TaxID=133190 RepID=UPI00061849A5|nr:sulfotransferase domain-containing protein [Sphingomonas sp. SRS2]KKC26961.1 sulfotransferase [Sphingomonas sp. SRS2]
MSGARKVEFLVAGVQKGGTSALFEYLRDLPGLQLPDVKEAHFFDDADRVDWVHPDYGPYHDLFVDDGRMWGEATPIYIYWPDAIARIAAYNPTMRFILLFRDPIQRAWSHWKMEYAKGKETRPFQWCIREGRARMDPDNIAAASHHRVFSYVERGFYGRQVSSLLKYFPREQCLFLRSEDLRDRPNTVIPEICSFLDQTSAPSVAVRIIHSAREQDYGTKLQPADIALLADTYADDLKQFGALTGIATSAWSARWKAEMNSIKPVD